MDKGPVERIGCMVSAAVADFSANPLAQVGFVVICVVWFTSGLPVEILTATLSVLAITLTQMVLNKQNEREAEAHRRDVALHAKIDELVHASRRARDEIAGIEELDEEEIERLRRAVAKGLPADDEPAAAPAAPSQPAPKPAPKPPAKKAPAAQRPRAAARRRAAAAGGVK